MNALVQPTAFIVELEQEVLGSLLAGGDFRKVAGSLQSKHFVEPIHARLFDVVKTAYERYNSTSVPVVARLIPADLDMAFKAKLETTAAGYLARLASNACFGPAGLETSARRVVEQWCRVNLADEAARLHAAANDPGSNPVELVTLAGQAFDDIMADMRRGARKKTRLSLAEATVDAVSSAKRARERGNGLTGITWGLSDVNRMTGGIQRRDLTLIAARPSMGKSTVGLSCALRAAKSGAGVGFISLEMDAEKLGARALSDLAYDWNVRVPYVDLIRGNVEDRDLEAVQAATRDLERLPLWIEDQSGLTMADIRTKTEALLDAAEKAGGSLQVLMIDHLGLIRASSRYAGNRANEIAEMTGGLKSMAREFNIAVVLLSQLNRAVENRDNKRPQLSDLRDSGAIEQDADTIIFLYREAYYLERENGGSMEAQAERAERMVDCQNKLSFDIAKQRNGPLGSIDLYADMACSAIRNGVRR